MANEQSNTPTPAQQPRTISLAQIHELPGVFNPKPVESKMGSLILSIQNSGVMEPVILRRRDDGEYQLLSGYRRVAASERAGKKDIPAFVYEMTMQEAIAYRKTVKNEPKAPIPGKLIAAEVEGKDKEKPIDSANITSAEKDGKEKTDAVPAAPGDKDKEQTVAGEKDNPNQPAAADKGKDGEKPADPEKAAPPKEDDKAKTDAAAAVPGDKDKAQAVAGEKDNNDQSTAADKGKDAGKSAESAGKEKHKPAAAELTTKANAGEPVKLPRPTTAQSRR